MGSELKDEGLGGEVRQRADDSDILEFDETGINTWEWRNWMGQA